MSTLQLMTLWTHRWHALERHARLALRRLSWTLAAIVIRLMRRAEPLLVRTLVGAERGQSMIEYAFVVALIAIGTVVAVRAFGVGISDVFNGLIERIRGTTLS